MLTLDLANPTARLDETPRGWRDVQDGDSSSTSLGIEMRLSDLALILKGIDLASVRRRKRWRRVPTPA